MSQYLSEPAHRLSVALVYTEDIAEHYEEAGVYGDGIDFGDGWRLAHEREAGEVHIFC